ncbi:hypothetical protein Cni_G14049 [Canna indica]|uniref:Glycosyltransferase family 92 protein n=1 Tax=Canna indica TaxID=4628 RepID=A0AAQ3KH05_9LILI|nr:hypothetical protein Cni_G14049 [Canna indica]
MGRKLKAALPATAIFLLFAASLWLHIFRDLLPFAAARFSRKYSTILYSHPVDRFRPNYAVRESIRSLPKLPPQAIAESVLLPDWEALVFLPSSSNSSTFPSGNSGTVSCLFNTGATSPARPAGTGAFRCILPNRLRRTLPFYTPSLVGSSFSAASQSQQDPPREMMRYTRLVYESVSTSNDVIVFAKGINRRQGTSSTVSGLRCVFSPASGGAIVAVTSVSSSAQEVFRCPHPPSANVSASGSLRVSLASGPDASPIPTVADYLSPRAASLGGAAEAARSPRASICACTMAYNVAKFLQEWVAYHAGIGVDRFFLYDNGSEDELEAAVSRLVSEGFNVMIRFWPWPKTQEAGFSHCAVVNRDTCEWMAFIDVDEFVFSPAWFKSDRPNKSMMGSLIKVDPRVGQVSIICLEFGPSGHRAHPHNGVTQGYTCRLRAESRHKSLVRLDAIDVSLLNSIHHFQLADGFYSRWMPIDTIRVNHYKYQAWKEFKIKFRRRVSTYVADWKENMNMGSNDRTPGLGFKPIKPDGWSHMFCEVNDTGLKEATLKWFSVDESHRMIGEK